MIDLERDLAPHRSALRSYCYRLLGTLADADAAAQEAVLRAWKAREGFEGGASPRTWLFQLASRVCFDQLSSRQRRSMPDLERGPSSPTSPTSPDEVRAWLEPAPDAWLEPHVGPDATIDQRESLGLAFLVALQALPSLERAVLVLREVLGHSAIETAEILESTVPAVNTALQRARATLDEAPLAKRPTEEAEQAMLTRYLEAWTRSDLKALVSTLREDTSLVMPPMAQWFVGASNLRAFFSLPSFFAPTIDAERFKAVATRAAGCPAVAVFRRPGPGSPWAPDSLHVLELRRDRIGRIAVWVTPSLHATFGLEQLPS